MPVFEEKDKESRDAEIRAALEEIREFKAEDLEQVCGGLENGDTREEYSTNLEDINRSIYGALLNH